MTSWFLRKHPITSDYDYQGAFEELFSKTSHFGRIINEIVKYKWWTIKLTQPVIAFDLPSMGEWQFIGPVLLHYAKTNPKQPILIVHQSDTIHVFNKSEIPIDNQVFHVRRRILDLDLSFPFSANKIAIFLTSEQYDFGLNGVYSIAMFHGQAAKGLSFVPHVINSFDGLFLNGPMHLEAFNLFVDDFLNGVLPKNIDLFHIGYPKSDAVINGLYQHSCSAEKFGPENTRKTILYAPAFNEGASLREYGTDIIESLSGLNKYNVIIKLPIDCWEPTTNAYATGGVDWFAKMAELEQRYNNIHFARDYEIDPLLACSDVLITCISSVGFEFMALNKPVVFIETPRYFSQYLQKRMPELDVTAWSERTTVNGGKEFGLVVSEVSELPAAIETVLRNPQEYPRQQEKLRSYLLYHPGKASERAVAVIEELMAIRPLSRRPVQRRSFKRVLQKAQGLLRSNIAGIIKRSFNARGYAVVRSGLGYIDAKSTVEAAKMVGLSVNAYLESKESDKRKVGRRDLIIATMQAYGVFQTVQNVCEIGAGTGQYLEKTLELAKTTIYEVYETDRGWVDFLTLEYGSIAGLDLRCHPADGRSLALSMSGSVDLVQAHGVFVYLPLLQTIEYLKECVRVCRNGGHIVFDCYLESTFASTNIIEAWLKTPYRFPVVIPSQLLKDFANVNALSLIHKFDVIHGAGVSVYFIYKKLQE